MLLTKQNLKNIILEHLSEGKKKSSLANEYATKILNSILEKKINFLVNISEELKKYVAYEDIFVTRVSNKPSLGQTFSAQGYLKPNNDTWRLILQVTYPDSFNKKDFSSAHRSLSELLTHEFRHGASIASSKDNIKDVEGFYASSKTVFNVPYSKIPEEVQKLMDKLNNLHDKEVFLAYAKSGEIEAFIEGWMKTFKNKKQKYYETFTDMIFFKLANLKNKLRNPDDPVVDELINVLFEKYKEYYMKRYVK